MKKEIEEEIEKLNASLHNFFQFRNTEAVNRLALLSLLLGAGAVMTGFFGMNFGRNFARVFFEPDKASLPIHYAAVIFAAAVALGAIGFGLYVVIRNWADYWETLALGRASERHNHGGGSLRKGPNPRGPRRAG
jgi:Mg2+ and Co2+ transporter CorA